MEVWIQAFANLKAYAPGGAGETLLSVPEGTTLQELLERLGIPPTVEVVALVNGKRAAAQTPLASGDRLTLFPPMEGG